MVRFATASLRLLVSLRAHRRLLAPVAALWALELLHPGLAAMPWIQLSLAALASLEGRSVFRRAFGALLGSSCRPRDVLAAAAALAGACLSFLLAALHTAGRLPPSLVDPRGGPVSFCAASGTVIALRAVFARGEASAPAGAGAGRKAGVAVWLLQALPIAFAIAALSLSLVVAADGPAWVMGAALAVLAGALPDAPAVLDHLRGDHRKALIAGGCEITAESEIDRMARIDWILFERSGVITLNQPRVTHVEPLTQDVRTEDVLHLAALAEYAVKHPIRDAIIESYGNRQRTVAKLPSSIFLPGRGVRTMYLGKELLVGNLRLLGDAGWPESTIQTLAERSRERAQRGETIVFVSLGEETLGLIALADTLRSDATRAFARLGRLGVKVAVFSGDLPQPLEALCRQFPGVEIHGAVGTAERDRLIESKRSSRSRPALVRRPHSGEPHHGELGFLLEWDMPPSPLSGPLPPGERRPASSSFVAGERLEGVADLVGAAKAMRRLGRRGALLVLLHHAVTVPVLCGALGPWIGVPPLPALAAVAAAAFPAALRLAAPLPRLPSK